MLTVLNAAILYNEVIFTLPRPNRHHHIVHAMHAMGLPKSANREQGFILSNGTWADRSLAWEIAKNANQFKGKPHHEYHLFSEDLW